MLNEKFNFYQMEFNKITFYEITIAKYKTHAIKEHEWAITRWRHFKYQVSHDEIADYMIKLCSLATKKFQR